LIAFVFCARISTAVKRTIATNAVFSLAEHIVYIISNCRLP
jgi:hypothetical protein